jgi:hypothetical protein
LEGTLRDSEVKKPLFVDLSSEGQTPRLEKSGEHFVVRAFTDLKRHKISDSEKTYFANETLVQGFAPTDQFITKRLWDVGNTGPYGHRGDLTTIEEAIGNHGGEARQSRLKYESLLTHEQRAIVAYLKTLQILPAGSASIVTESEPIDLPYRR